MKNGNENFSGGNLNLSKFLITFHHTHIHYRRRFRFYMVVDSIGYENTSNRWIGQLFRSNINIIFLPCRTQLIHQQSVIPLLVEQEK